MEIGIGAEVRDREGQVLGKVDHLARDTWTGEIRKFIVRRPAPAKDLFLVPEDVLTVAEGTITLKESQEELDKR